MVNQLDAIDPPTGREADAANRVSHLTEARDAAAGVATAAASGNAGAVNQQVAQFNRAFPRFLALADSLEASDCASL